VPEPPSPPPQPGPRLIVEPLGRHHDRAAFSCGAAELDNYLRRQASQDDKRDLSRTFVLIAGENRAEVLGYYTLSSYSITFAALPLELGKHLPSAVLLPATLLGRLAIHESWQGRNLGTMLLYHAMRQALRATRMVASIGIVVDAMNDDLVTFYARNGFVPLRDKPRHLIAPISRIQRIYPEDALALPGVEDILHQIQSSGPADKQP
jgi:GNAT superfamily N-acetyltransferase